MIQDGNIEIGADNGIEADNLSSNNDAEARAMPWIANATFIGRSDTNGALLRAGTGVKITNAIFTDFGTCIDIDGCFNVHQRRYTTEWVDRQPDHGKHHYQLRHALR